MTLRFRIIASLVLVQSLTLLMANSAQAHRFAPSLLKIVETTPDEYNVVWKTPTQTTSSISLRPAWPDSCEVMSESPALREGTANLASWTLRCDQFGEEGLVGQALGVTGLAANQVSAIVMLSLHDGRHYQRVLNAEISEFLVPAVPSQAQVMTEYPVLGIKHIWGGLDHLMFVFGLLLLVGGGSRLLWTITAFTVGHSITLAMVTLGLFNYPVDLIEFTIALSIFVLAVQLASKDRNNANTNERSFFRQHPWWLAGGFGLLHGMGFAGALVEIGLPQNNVPLALLFFNVGIEIGQIVFVLLALSAWWLIKRTVAITHEWLLPIPVYTLGGLSVMWCIERGLDLIG